MEHYSTRLKVIGFFWLKSLQIIPFTQLHFSYKHFTARSHDMESRFLFNFHWFSSPKRR